MNLKKILRAAIGFVALLLSAGTASAISPDVVISQVYGGGGNTGATFRNDFIELFNRTGSPVSLTGWSVQYASSTGSSWSVTPLAGSIPAYGYYLIQQAAGTGGTVLLPTPDAIGTITMSGTTAKVALVKVTTALTGSNPTSADIVDLIGWGAAPSAYETAPAGATSNTTAAIRKLDGCTETDNNSTDFAIAAPNPRNSAAPQNPCVTGDPTLSNVLASWVDGTTLKIEATLSAAATVKLESTTDFLTWTPGASAAEVAGTVSRTVTVSGDRQFFRLTTAP